MVATERGSNGRFVRGGHYSPKTEFKKGTHWRQHKPYWDKDWLYREYSDHKRSAADIAKDFGVTENAILFWLDKHGIKRRTTSEARTVKRWGSFGKENPMYGHTGKKNPNWRGGCTPDRQAFYSSEEWGKVVQKVWARDEYRCQLCGASEHGLHIHHIIPFSEKAHRADPDNLVLLCRKCHNFVHSTRNVEGVFLNGHLRRTRDP